MRTILTIALIVQSGTSWAQLSCDPDLFRDFVSSHADVKVTLSTLELVNSSNFDSLKRNFSGDIILPIDGVPVNFGSRYGELDTKRQQIKSERRFSYALEDARSFVSNYFSARSTPAYLACLKAYENTNAGLHLRADEVADDAVTFLLRWKNPNNDSRRAVGPLDVFRSGTKSEELSFDLGVNSEARFVLRRSLNQSIIIRAQANGYSPVLSVPKDPIVPPQVAALNPDPLPIARHPELMIRGSAHGGVKFGKVYWQDNVLIGLDAVNKNGRVIGLHPGTTDAPNSQESDIAYVELRIPMGAKYFRSEFGMAQLSTRHPNEHAGHASGRIYVDGNRVWEKDISGLEVVSTPVIGLPQGSRILRLEVDPLGSPYYDHTTWVDPIFSATASPP